MASDSNTWAPPVLFHFSVEFQWDGDRASASFSEVDGLGQELELARPEKGNGNEKELPKDVKVTDLTLKRAVEPVNEKITVWVKNTFRFLYGAKIKPCTLLICLLDGQGKPAAKWICERAFPVKWTVSPLNASESRIAIETITLRYETLRRGN